VLRRTLKLAAVLTAIIVCGGAHAAVVTDIFDPADVLISTPGGDYSYTHKVRQTFTPGSITSVTLDLFFTDDGGSETFTVSYSDAFPVGAFTFKNVANNSDFPDTWLADEFEAIYDGIVSVNIHLERTNPSKPGATFTHSVLTIAYDADTGDLAAAATDVSEPATLALLGASLIGFLRLRQRRS
jgi:hypothetical protein